MTTVTQLNTSYAEQDVGFAGMLADSGDNRVESYVQGEASEEIAFGWGVVQGTEGTPPAADKAIKPVDANSKVVGIVLHSHNYHPDVELGTTGVKPKAMLSVLKKGVVYLYVEDTVVKDANLYLRYTANGAGKLVGQWRSDADSSKALLVRGVTAAASRTGAGLVKCNVDIDVNNAVAGLS
jgi:hypothetical protein